MCLHLVFWHQSRHFIVPELRASTAMKTSIVHRMMQSSFSKQTGSVFHYHDVRHVEFTMRFFLATCSPLFIGGDHDTKTHSLVPLCHTVQACTHQTCITTSYWHTVLLVTVVQVQHRNSQACSATSALSQHTERA